jgi:hypothetical protein
MDIHCKYCCGEIQCREDLVVTTNLLKVNTYHNQCYSEILKTSEAITLGEPINSLKLTVLAIIGPILSLILFFLIRNSEDIYYKGISLILLVPAIYRLYSWNRYEKKL